MKTPIALHLPELLPNKNAKLWIHIENKKKYLYSFENFTKDLTLFTKLLGLRYFKVWLQLCSVEWSVECSVQCSKQSAEYSVECRVYSKM